MVSDITTSVAGLALGIGLTYVFIHYVNACHIWFALLFLAGSTVAAMGGLFLAWPFTHHIELPMLTGVLLWSGLWVCLFVQNTS